MVEMSYSDEDVCDKKDSYITNVRYVYGNKEIRIFFRKAILMHLLSIIKALNSGDFMRTDCDDVREQIRDSAIFIKKIIDDCSFPGKKLPEIKE